VELVPSPKDQAKVYGAVPPVGLPVNVTASGASPAGDEALDAADKGPLTVIVSEVAWTVVPLASATVRSALKRPAVV
jgi:hypothetical protein